jgi:NDP-sugar pyrophosphorylase family protein
MALQCVVLAGGLGTRMRPFTNQQPKALVPVLGRPFVDWQVRWLVAQHVDRLTFCIGHGGQLLQDYLGDGSRFGVEIHWVSEGDQLKGTGGALRLALDNDALEDAFFILYGDSYLPIEMSLVERAWRGAGFPAQMTVLRNEGRWDSSNAVYSKGRIVLYDKRAPASERGRMLWIDYGLSIVSRQLVGDRIAAGAIADLADLLRALSLEGQLGGYEVSDRFYEVGSPQGVADLEAYLRRRPAGAWPPAI